MTKTTHRANRMPRAHAGGFSLLEMLVAISLSSVLIITILQVWHNLNNQTTVQARRVMFESEANLIADNMSTELRRASGIISMEERAVTFATEKKDTVRFSFDGELLRRNEQPVGFTKKDMATLSFTLEWSQEEIDELSRRIHSLIRFSLQFEDSFDNRITLTRDVAVPYFSGSDDVASEEWLF
ncbi:MAG: PulJ/GspJ family protein [Chitinivibrionales bacterium]